MSKQNMPPTIIMPWLSVDCNPPKQSDGHGSWNDVNVLDPSNGRIFQLCVTDARACKGMYWSRMEEWTVAHRKFWMTEDGDCQGVTIEQYLAEWADKGDIAEIRHAFELPPTFVVVTSGMLDYREFATREEAEEFAKELLK